MGVASARPGDRARGWIRSPGFDLTLIVGVLVVALALGGLAAAAPALFVPILLADLWLFAYPHVASTMTRIALDRESARANWALLVIAPPLVLAATTGVAVWGGAMALNTLYFAWQSLHYTRQSYGLSRAYRRAAGHPAEGRDLATDVVVFSLPLWGVLYRAAQAHPTFYRMPLYSPPVPAPLLYAAGAVALVSLGVWCVQRARAVLAGDRASVPGTLFVASHVLITLVSYFALRDVTEGWLFLNVWHNAQYLLFVWAMNARDFSGGRDPARPLLSWLSQPRHVAWYALGCLGVSATFYWLLGHVSAPSLERVVPVVLVTHMAVNFYHYVVDAFIWRTPRRTLGGMPARAAA